MSSYIIGDKIRIINEMHRNHEVGYVERIAINKIEGSSWGDTYYVRFKDGGVSSFFESNLQHESGRTIQVGKVYYYEKAGAISSVFIETFPISYINESVQLSNIREVAMEDVTSKHFKDWFFKLKDWVDEGPEDFPYIIITHTAAHSVYGYFNNNKLDAMIKLVKDDDGYYEISFFCVNPGQQSKGIGQILFQYVLNEYYDKDLQLSVYTDNTPAIHIYKKYGFIIIGAGYNKGIKPKSMHYVMQKDKGS